MEKIKNKDEFKKAQQEIAELSARISRLEVEYNALNDKYLKEDLKRGEFERRLEISKELRDLRAERSAKQSRVTSFINEDVQRIARLAAEEERINSESYSKPEPKNSAPEKKDPEKKETSKVNGTRVGIFAIIAMLIVIGILAHKDKEIKSETARQTYDQEFKDLSSRTYMSESEIVDSIEGIKRMFYSGRLPEGEYLGELTYDYYLQKEVELFGVLGNPKDCYKPYCSVDRADLVEDGALKEFIAKYDVVYADIAKGLNSKDYASVELNIQKLADMQFDDFKMAGLNGGINPYGFEPQYKMTALLAATDRYAMVAEYAAQNKVCFSPCLNLATGKKTKVNVLSMYYALMAKGGVSPDGKIVLDSLGVNFPEDLSLWDIFRAEGLAYFAARNENLLTRIIK